MPATVTGYITRSNLPSPLANLTITVDPLWLLPGDASQDASISMSPGVQAAQSVVRYTWAQSPFVAGSQLVHAVQDNSSLDLRLICDGGGNLADAQSYASEVITAVTGQQTFQVSLTWDSGLPDTVTNTWNCYMGTYLAAFNQLYTFGYTLPLYISCPRDPTPAAGGI